MDKHSRTVTGSIESWKAQVLEGKSVNTKLVKGIRLLRDKILKEGFLMGDPFQDWLNVRKELGLSDVIEISKVAETARQMSYLRRGTQIIDRLSNDWKNNGAYLNALADLDGAVYQAQISDSYIPQRGIVIMNIHKSKGKEFDHVILVDGLYSNAIVYGDRHPYVSFDCAEFYLSFIPIN